MIALDKKVAVVRMSTSAMAPEHLIFASEPSDAESQADFDPGRTTDCPRLGADRGVADVAGNLPNGDANGRPEGNYPHHLQH
jgi:hypothetical protein